MKSIIVFSILGFMISTPCIISIEARGNKNIEKFFIITSMVSIFTFAISIVIYILSKN